MHIIISTGLGTGFIPKAPGTTGAFWALSIWIGLYYILSPIWLFIAAISLVVGSFVIGVWTDNVMEKYWGEAPRAVVIDEFFGTWISAMSVLFLSDSPYMFITLSTVAFALFRIIDITSHWDVDGSTRTFMGV